MESHKDIATNCKELNVWKLYNFDYSQPLVIWNFWDLGNLFWITNFRIFEDTSYSKCSVHENSVWITRFPDKRVPDNRGLTVISQILYWYTAIKNKDGWN